MWGDCPQVASPVLGASCAVDGKGWALPCRLEGLELHLGDSGVIMTAEMNVKESSA